MADATHNTNISISISLNAAPLQRAGFGSVLFLGRDVALSGGAKFKEYTTYSEMVTAFDASEINANAKAAGAVAFAQTPRPAKFLVGLWDDAGADNPSDALQDCIDAGAEFWAVCVDSRTAAEQIDLATAINALEHIGVYQSSDATWLTASIPAAYSAMAGQERSVMHYHDDDTEWGDVAHAVSRSTFDPDVQSATWTGALQGVGAAAGVDSAERTLCLANNCNLVLAYGSAAAYVDAGVNLAGRAVEEILTMDWFSNRIDAATASLKLNRDAAGLKIPVTQEGQQLVKASVFDPVFQAGVSAGHFVEGQTLVTFPSPIPQADIDAREIKASGSAQLETGARLFTFDFNLSRSAVNES